MVALKLRYLNTFIQATNRFSADRVLRMLDLLTTNKASIRIKRISPSVLGKNSY